jgi:hypothetical protein
VYFANLKNIYQLFAVAVFIISLVSCSGDDDNKGLHPIASSDPGGVQTDIDCLNLDPGRVYAVGTLIEGLAGREVLFDPVDPTSFCVGFPSYHEDGFITADGEYIFADGASLNFYTMVPDEIDWTPDGATWSYPANPLDNDLLLFTATQPGCGLDTVTLNPASSEIVYSCPNDTIHTESQADYYSLVNDDLLGVMPDGSLLVAGNATLLRLVDDNMAETVLTLPAAAPADTVFYTAKQYLDPVTGNSSVWIVTEYGTGDGLRRLSLDLATLNITDEGLFVAAPVIISNNTSVKLDGDGMLWQMGIDINSNDVISSRPLLSSGGSAAVVYTEEDELQGPLVLFAWLHASDLVTGL